MKRSELVNILQIIYAQGRTSRSSLAEKMRLAPSSITVLVRHLQDRGLVKEIGRAPSRAGRRRVLLHVNPDLAHLVGVRIGRANIRIVVTDFLGTILSLKNLRTEMSQGQAHVLARIHSEVHPLIEKDPAIKGIGVAMSGVIARESGTVLFWPKVSGWNDVPLRRIIEHEYGLPTVIEDSVRTMALVEQSLGEGRGHKDFVYVKMGVGIGAAIFVSGNLYFGFGGLAGELGHTTIDETGDLCSCGNRGCLEVYASGWAIINRLRTGLQQGVSSSLAPLFERHPEQLSVEAIVAAARRRDRLSQTVLSEAGTHLGVGLASIVNLLNPEIIILGGDVPQAAKEFLLRPLFHSLRARAFHRSVANLKVVTSRLGGEAGAVGAALLIGEKLLPQFE